MQISENCTFNDITVKLINAKLIGINTYWDEGRTAFWVISPGPKDSPIPITTQRKNSPHARESHLHVQAIAPQQFLDNNNNDNNNNNDDDNNNNNNGKRIVVR
jgi:hypothetical protein